MSQTHESTKEANRIVRTHTGVALAVGLVPFPLVDMALLSAIQVKMLHSLARLYEVEFSKHLGKSSIAGSVGSSVIYPAISLAKFIPVSGWLATMGSVALVSGISTYVVGKVFIQHFASGGTFLTFDPQRVQDYYEQLFRQGKLGIQGSPARVRP